VRSRKPKTIPRTRAQPLNSLRGQGLKKVVYLKKLKAYRIDKKNPKDTTVTIEQDLGDKKEVTTLKAHSFEEETRIIPKKKGEDFDIVWQYGAYKIKRCISTGKYYAYIGYYPNDKFDQEVHLGSMYDMADVIFSDIGAITKTLAKDGRGHPFMRISVWTKKHWESIMKRKGRL